MGSGAVEMGGNDVLLVELYIGDVMGCIGSTLKPPG